MNITLLYDKMTLEYYIYLELIIMAIILITIPHSLHERPAHSNQNYPLYLREIFYFIFILFVDFLWLDLNIMLFNKIPHISELL